LRCVRIDYRATRYEPRANFALNDLLRERRIQTAPIEKEISDLLQRPRFKSRRTNRANVQVGF